MKKINKLFTLLVILLISTPLYSQWRFGFNVAYENTGANWILNENNKTLNNISGFSLGPIVAYEAVEQYLDVQSGLNFAMNGFSIQDQSIFGNNHILSEQEITHLYFLQVPIYAVGKLPIKEATLLLEVGPILAAGVGSKTTTSFMVGNAEYTMESDDIFQEVLTPFNCLIHFGIGAEYKGARITLGYNLGVFDMIKDSSIRSDLKTDGFFVSLGYIYDFD